MEGQDLDVTPKPGVDSDASTTTFTTTDTTTKVGKNAFSFLQGEPEAAQSGNRVRKSAPLSIPKTTKDQDEFEEPTQIPGKTKKPSLKVELLPMPKKVRGGREGNWKATQKLKKRKKTAIFCDLDGCLADFDKGVQELTGEEVTELFKTERGRTSMWEAIRADTTFYEKLSWMPDGEQLWKFLQNVAKEQGDEFLKPVVLTGLPKFMDLATRGKKVQSRLDCRLCVVIDWLAQEGYAIVMPSLKVAWWCRLCFCFYICPDDLNAN